MLKNNIPTRCPWHRIYGDSQALQVEENERLNSRENELLGVTLDIVKIARNIKEIGIKLTLLVIGLCIPEVSQ